MGISDRDSEKVKLQQRNMMVAKPEDVKTLSLFMDK